MKTGEFMGYSVAKKRIPTPSSSLLFQDAYALLLSKVLKRRSAALSVQRLVAAAVSAAIAVKEGQLRREAEEAK